MAMLPEQLCYGPGPEQLESLGGNWTSEVSAWGAQPAADTPSGVRNLCGTCGQKFGRPQELKRHVEYVHSPPRHCPFCPFQWKRPDKIRTHLLEVHHDVPSAGALQEIHPRRGLGLVEFLDTYEHVRHNAIPQAGASSTPLFPAPAKETLDPHTKLPIPPHPLPDHNTSPTAFNATSPHAQQALGQPNEPRGSPWIRDICFLCIRTLEKIGLTC